MNMLDRLYAELTARTGIMRIRDTRLEMLAMDRALEARYQVGTEGSTGITHPIAQLQARTIPLHPTNATAVYENAMWFYLATLDPVRLVVDGWMNSPAHRANLERLDTLTWGLGYHEEPPTGTQTQPRRYFIAIFTRELRPIVRPRVAFDEGEHTGYQFTATGTVIAEKIAPLARPSGANYDIRWDVPGKGPHLHITNGIWRNHWVPESARVYTV